MTKKGRPSKTTVDYFPHQVKHKKTIFTLESLYGNDGYAFWFKLLELLGDTPGHAYDFSAKPDWFYLIAKVGLSGEKSTEILKLLCDLGAIDPDLYQQKVVWSDNFVDGLRGVYEKRSTEIPPKPTFRPEKGLSDPKKRQSRVEKSKVEKEKSTKKENGRFTPPSLSETIAYFISKGSTADEAETFIDHFTSNGWKVSGKAPMKCWKSASRNWIKRTGSFKKTNNGGSYDEHTEFKRAIATNLIRKRLEKQGDPGTGG